MSRTKLPVNSVLEVQLSPKEALHGVISVVTFSSYPLGHQQSVPQTFSVAGQSSVNSDLGTGVPVPSKFRHNFHLMGECISLQAQGQIRRNGSYTITSKLVLKLRQDGQKPASLC